MVTSAHHGWTPSQDKFILKHWGKPGWSATRIGHELGGLTRHQVRGRHLTLMKRFEDSVAEQPTDGPRAEWSGDFCHDDQVSCVFHVELDEVIKDPQQLLERANIRYDAETWKIGPWKIGTWSTPVKTASKRIENPPEGQNQRWESEVSVIQNYKVQISFIRRQPLEPELVQRQLIEEAKRFAPVYPALPSPDLPKGGAHMLEICIFDLHYGKYGWRPETGTNYDIDIAEELFFHALHQLVRRSSTFPIEQILLPVGNDLMHTNNLAGTTERGTRQDVDTRIKHVMKKCRQMLIKGIDTLQQIAPVVVKVVPGNHDPLTCWAVGEALECWYHRCKRVTIDNHPYPRKYHLWNNVLLGFTHLDREKKGTLPGLMAVEAREAWARARFCEFHGGHVHKRTGWEYMTCDAETGVVVRTMDSLSGNDAWHTEEGYVGGPKAANAMVWHEHHGCVAEYIATAPEAAYA